jgi:L-ascorbate metabolism protein UlaG (beta-lactamase superfamily)
MPSMPSPSQERNQTSESTPQALMIRRIGWAAFEIVTERGTRLILDPYFSGSKEPMPDYQRVLLPLRILLLQISYW